MSDQVKVTGVWFKSLCHYRMSGTFDSDFIIWFGGFSSDCQIKITVDIVVLF